MNSTQKIWLLVSFLVALVIVVVSIKNVQPKRYAPSSSDPVNTNTNNNSTAKTVSYKLSDLINSIKQKNNA